MNEELEFEEVSKRIQEVLNVVNGLCLMDRAKIIASSLCTVLHYGVEHGMITKVESLKLMDYVQSEYKIHVNDHLK